MSLIKIIGKTIATNTGKFIAKDTTPKYLLERSVTPTESGGSEITFTVNTTNVSNGTEIPYTVTGISEENVVSGDLSGNFTVNNNTASTTLEVDLGPSSPGVGSATLTLDNGEGTIVVFPITPETVLYLGGDGPNDSNNSVFLDSSSNNFTITRNGNVTQGSFSPFALNGASYNPSVHGGSGYFNGSGSYLQLPSNSAQFQFGTGDFTAESWVYLPSSSTFNGLSPLWGDVKWYSGYQSGWLVMIQGEDRKVVFRQGGQIYAWDELVSTNPISSNAWTHIAIGRHSGTSYLFINGILQTTKSSSWNYMNSEPFKVGASSIDGLVTGSTAYYLNGPRIVNGTALYTSNFSVPTAPLTNISNTSLLLNFTNGGIIDGTAKNDLTSFGNTKISTSIKKNGSGSIYFDGNGDYLTAPNNNQFNFGTGDFTVEAWVNFTNLNVNRIICSNWTNTTNTGWQMYYRYNDNKISFYVGSSVAIQSNETITPNQWHHIAVTRQGSTLRIFVNGIGNSVSNSANLDSTNPNLEIGYQSTGTSRLYHYGYIDDLIITKGLAKYTSNFTPV